MQKTSLNVRVLAMLKQSIGSINEKRANDILDNLELGWQIPQIPENNEVEIGNAFTLEKVNVSGSLVLNTVLTLNLDDKATICDFMKDTKVVCRGTDKIKNVEVLDYLISGK